MNMVYLGLGSNLGDKENNLATAIKLLEEKAGKLIKASSVYETEPWQMDDSIPFFNQVIYIETELSSLALLECILRIEEYMGRVRQNSVKYEPRIIDIDILFFNNDILESDLLTLPHPFIAQRRFVLVPLNEIAPDYIHPTFKTGVSQLLMDCLDSLIVKQLVKK